VPDVLANQIVTGDGNKVVRADVAEPVQDVGHAQGNRRLAGPRIAGERHVERRRRARQAVVPA
jgi:hypothetical protein